MTAAELELHLLDTIPMARAMGLKLVGHEAGRLSLHAPLMTNRNDKGCAFGGSLASLMTLACWGLAVLALDEAGDQAEVYVQDSQIRYLAPVWEDIEVSARFDEEDSTGAFTTTYSARGRARATLRCECRLCDGTLASDIVARFVALDPSRRRPA